MTEAGYPTKSGGRPNGWKRELETMKKTVAIQTMGCKANQYDSAVLEGMISNAGWHLVDATQPADAYIINTCTVTNEADKEARYLIRKAHRKNPEASIVVTGCSAQVDPQALAAVEGVSFILGNSEKTSILDYLNQAKPLVPKIVVEDIFQEDDFFSSSVTSYSKNTRAFLKIQDGCNQMCSYCVIPFARGKNRSLLPEKVLEELFMLSEKGFDEAVLTGIHIGTYGYDLFPKTSLLELMKRIEDEKPIHRVRVSSIDPEEVDEEMIEFLSTSKVFCEHLHIPLQSGDDVILKLMRRRYTGSEFRDLTFKLKEKIPGICLGTDVMVGFPYEDQERFESGFKVIQESALDYLHVFPYAPKKNTRAEKFVHQVSPSEKRLRVEKLMEYSQKIRNHFLESHIGNTFELIVEEYYENLGGVYKGMSRNYIPVEFISDKNLKGKLVFGQICRYDAGHVFGKIVEG